MIFITGGSGFVGSSLCARLSQRQIEFAILDKRRSSLFPDEHLHCDICDIGRLRELLNGDTIVHLAAEHRDDVRPISRYRDVNVLGTENVAQVAREKGIERIVFTSTVAVYGFAPPGTDEDASTNPFNEYGKTKLDAEKVLRAWQSEAPEARSLTIIRPTVIFGPGNRGNVFNLLSSISAGRFLMVGSGKNRKSMAYVGNVAAFIEHATSFGPGVRLFNYVDTPDLTMNELVTLVRYKLFGKQGVGLRVPYSIGLVAGYAADVASGFSKKSLPLSSIRVRKFCANTSFASSAHRVAGFQAEASLAAALELTLQQEFLSPDPTAPIFFTE